MRIDAKDLHNVADKHVSRPPNCITWKKTFLTINRIYGKSLQLFILFFFSFSQKQDQAVALSFFTDGIHTQFCCVNGFKTSCTICHIHSNWVNMRPLMQFRFAIILYGKKSIIKVSFDEHRLFLRFAELDSSMFFSTATKMRFSHSSFCFVGVNNCLR